MNPHQLCDPKPWFRVLAFCCTSLFPRLSPGEPLFSHWFLISLLSFVSKWKKLVGNAVKYCLRGAEPAIKNR